MLTRTILQNFLFSDEILSADAQTNMKEQDDKALQKRLDGWMLSVNKIIEEYEHFLKANQESLDLCKEELAVGDDWEFETALLFATTVVTTIGNVSVTSHFR